MPGMRSWRKASKRLIVFGLAWEAAATVAGLVVFVFVAARGGLTSPDRVISVAGSLGVFGVATWAIWDARMRSRRRRQRPERVVASEEEA